ncbi:MAG: tRNA uridine(34) 5-carboxymethylaminomethyl modification radical SAM/GNAT enzyme Elp3 [Methanomicrobiales archaeon]|nr:tRNA uridine(34) 5-carboxymethylaminomethyl modification radical SAM/GNAT enzyme Elp3 [Methanomicrobiales archaeon]MDD1668944.1 tRNA uridine(34) 5-carboxymethylaminomethyl modification radical SAM/GNAT enzyme Elp3 [Methanomicrobiales archaeon]
MDEFTICREIISRLSSHPLSPSLLEHLKIEVCRAHHSPVIPKNSAILAAADPGERERLRDILLLKPTRTLSGVAPVAVMTSPAPCPHGKCLPCPGGPDHPFGTPQSYTGEEPATLRAREHDYDPYLQVRARLDQFRALGHHVDKAELIVMGGTMTARPQQYQREFVAGCLRAMNESGGRPSAADTFEALAGENEAAGVRCVAMTFETRPDYCRREHVREMLSLGVTKVELGVQHTDDRILDLNRRGCRVGDAVEANRLLRDSGFKVGFHVMPNLPGATLADDEGMFLALFADERFRPDFLKIYPTLVTPGSGIEELHLRGEYEPFPEPELVDLIARAKAMIPPYVRLQRVQRDIPAKLITAGSTHGNLRQLAKARLAELGGTCRCIRCREAGRSSPSGTPSVETLSFRCCGGTEHFISAAAGDSLIGYARLRFPGTTEHPDLENASLLRELHVYGSLVPLGKSAEGPEWQHRSYGGLLLRRAEEISRSGGYRSIAVLSGIGVRPYYRQRGYERRGPYMIKDLG